MCGIIAFSAQDELIKSLVNGLYALEYRGYDSAGIAFISNSKIKCIKTKGKVDNLKNKIDKIDDLNSSGIAHTRWATHGNASLINAHPHLSGDFAIVHNGIIENYQCIKTKLIENDYQFKSSTDSEVIAHLLDFNFKKSKDVNLAFYNTILELEGSFAIVALCSKTNTILAARYKSPLLIAKNKATLALASDMSALLGFSQVYEMPDNSIAQIHGSNLDVFDLNHKRLEAKFKEYQIQETSFHKGDFEHFTLKEIFEQPSVFDKTYKALNSNDSILKQANFIKMLAKINEINIIACGSSYHSALCASYYFEKYAQIRTNTDIASEFRYRAPYLNKNALYILISQSGETADTLSCLSLLKNHHTLAISNTKNSTLVREADFHLLTHAGVEIGVASTKAFTSQLLVLLKLNISLSKARHNNVNTEIYEKELANLSFKAHQFLKLDRQIVDLVDFFNQDKALFLGRDSLYPIALEGALKLKEISYIYAQACALGELKHGPLALIDKDLPIVMLANKNELINKVKANMQEITARGGHIILFSDKDITWNQDNLTIIQMPSVSDFVTPILYTIPMQLLSYHIANKLVDDLDKPRNLAKSVTVE